MTVMPTTPDDQGDDAPSAATGRSDAAGNSLRFMTRNPSDGQREQRPRDVAAAGQVQHHADGEGPHRDHEGPPLAASHPPGQGQEPDPHQRHQGARGLAGDEGEQLAAPGGDGPATAGSRR